MREAEGKCGVGSVLTYNVQGPARAWLLPWAIKLSVIDVTAADKSLGV